jgi:hypothetical protein
MELELPEQVRERLALVLRDFAGASRGDFHDLSFHRVPIEPRRVPVPSLYRYVLLEAVGGVDLPLDEKMAFDVGFRYENVPCTLALQKFGIRVYVATKVPDGKVRQFSDRLLGKLTKGVELLEKQVLRPLADQQLAEGNVTIANQRGFLRTTYEHFRDEARRAFATPPAKPPSPKRWWRRSPSWRRPSPVASLGLAELVGGEFRKSQIGAYNTLAAVNAYFSLLEHTLVLVLPFSGFDPSGGALATFIRDRWGEKLTKLFDVGKDPEASRHYNRLRDIAETFRNTYSHGGFDKEGAAVWVHFPFGAIPARLSDVRDAPHFELFPVGEADLEEIVAAFEAVDEWLRQAHTEYGMHWAEAGLDVAYDAESRAEYAEAMASATEFEEFLERSAYRADAIANFEF